MVDGAGNCNLTRTAAAQAEIEFLATDPTGSKDPDVIVLGDLNAYRMEDPITTFGAGPGTRTSSTATSAPVRTASSSTA